MTTLPLSVILCRAMIVVASRGLVDALKKSAGDWYCAMDSNVSFLAWKLHNEGLPSNRFLV